MKYLDFLIFWLVFNLCNKYIGASNVVIGKQETASGTPKSSPPVQRSASSSDLSSFSESKSYLATVLRRKTKWVINF